VADARGTESEKLLWVVQCYMNYNALRHFFKDDDLGGEPWVGFPRTPLANFTPKYRYPAAAAGAEIGHFARITAFEAKCARIFAMVSPIGANQMDVIIATHLWITNNCPELNYGADQAPNNYGGPNFPYQDAYMGMMGANGSGAKGIGSCMGWGELDAFIMLQCGVNAYPISQFQSEFASGPSPYQHAYTTMGGGHGVCGFEYRGKKYLTDPVEGGSYAGNSTCGDVNSLFASQGDVTYNAWVRGNFNNGWAPLTRTPAVGLCQSTDYMIFRHATLTEGVNWVPYKVKQNIAEHTVTFPVLANYNQPNKLYWATYSTEYEAIIKLEAQQ